MPNLHWYGTQADHYDILSDIISTDQTQIFGHFSIPDHPIASFSDVESILAEFDVLHIGENHRIRLNLNIWVKASGLNPTIDRVVLDPAKCGGATWRERCGPPGFVQLYIERALGGVLNHSQTNTASEARMRAVDGKHTDKSGFTWDIAATNRFSQKLNRMIRKRAVGKLGTKFVLPGAAAFGNEGGKLGRIDFKSESAARYTH